MLKSMRDLPSEVDGLLADGRITRGDYAAAIQPLLQGARRDGRRIRLLLEFAPSFEGFSPDAAWEEARIGLHSMRLFKRIGIVSPMARIRERARLIAAIVPLSVHVFPDSAAALDWLCANVTPHISHHLIPQSSVLVVEPRGPLRPEDFDTIALVVDPWIESHGSLRGLVVHMNEFPGWESVGGFVRHVQFVRDHHRTVHRVALASEGGFAQLAPHLAAHFVRAELKHFGYGELDRAVEWAGAYTETS
jgi:hypothetical protein